LALILAGANVNATDAYLNTPLHFSAQDGNQMMTNGLLRAGANPNLRNRRGQNPFEFARTNRLQSLFLSSLRPQGSTWFGPQLRVHAPQDLELGFPTETIFPQMRTALSFLLFVLHESTYFSALPDEIIKYILEFLSAGDLWLLGGKLDKYKRDRDNRRDPGSSRELLSH
jgi:hypothetical protein